MVAPLSEIKVVCEKYDFMLFVLILDYGFTKDMCTAFGGIVGW